MKSNNSSPNFPPDWVSEQLDRGRTPLEISNDLCRGWHIPKLPFLERSQSVSTASLPDLFDSAVSESTKSRLQPYVQEMLHRLAQGEQLDDIAYDLSVRTQVPLKEAIGFSYSFYATIRSELAKLTGQGVSGLEESAEDILTKFIVNGQPLADNGDELNAILDEYGKYRLDQQSLQTCLTATERIRTHDFLIEAIGRIAGRLDTNASSQEQRLQVLSKVVSQMAIRSCIVGMRYSYLMWDADELRDALSFLRTVLESAKTYFVDRLMVLQGAPENDLRQITKNTGILSRLCAAECYCIGLEAMRIFDATLSPQSDD